MEPKNGGLEDDFPFELGDFKVPSQFSGVFSFTSGFFKSPTEHSFFESG